MKKATSYLCIIFAIAATSCAGGNSSSKAEQAKAQVPYQDSLPAPNATPSTKTSAVKRGYCVFHFARPLITLSLIKEITALIL